MQLKPEEIIRQRILQQYKSIRAFTQAIQVPYSTVDSLLKRGLSGSSAAVALKVCRALDLELEDLLPVLSQPPLSSSQDPEEAPPLGGDFPQGGDFPPGGDPPLEGEPPLNQEAAQVGLQLYQLLIDAGWVKEGQDITSRQQRILQAMVELLSAEFH